MCCEFEIWKDIPGYEEYYQISSFGRVKSKKRFVMNRHGTLSVRRPSFRKSTESRWYLGVNLCKNGDIVRVYIHRLMALVFMDLINNTDLVVNHIDGDKQNNNLENLEIVSQQENVAHAKRIGLRNYYGENSSLAKMTNSEVDDIRNKYKKGQTQVSLAEEYNVTQATISNIIRYKTYFK